MSTNDEKIKEMLNSETVPQELEPENIRIMLDEKAPVKKRKNIKKTAARITAGAAACAVICGTSVYFAGQRDLSDKAKKDSGRKSSENSIFELPSFDIGNNDLELNTQAAYMSGASGYKEVYQLYKKAEEKYSENKKNDYATETARGDYFEIAEAPEAVNGNDYSEMKSETEENMDMAPDDGAVADEQQEETEVPVQDATMASPEDTDGEDIPEYTEPAAAPETTESEPTDDEESGADHSETYNQEEGVLEADIVKTDGEYIYYLYNCDMGSTEYEMGGVSDYYQNTAAKLNIASVEDGTFTGSQTIDIDVAADYAFGEGYSDTSMYVSDMYLYNDMLLVVGTVSAEKTEEIKNGGSLFRALDIVEDSYNDVYYCSKSAVFVSVYTTGDDPQLIDTYYQEGGYDDVRISPDGYMYLVSDYTTQEFGVIESEEQLEGYIPKCGVGRGTEFLPPEDILMPDEELEESETFSCTVIGSLDLNTSGEITAVDSKALAGYTGEIYSSAGNLYTTVGWDDTEITRIAISEGTITPAANGTVEGRVKDQFSMSEYDGYFRIATTKDSYEDTTEEYTWFDEDDIPHTESYVTHSLRKRDNRVYVLDMDMNIVGSLADFGVDEEIKSVNFSGNTAYVVTYEQTDPLFAIDLSDPANPTIMDEFKILGYSTYMQQWQDGMLLGFGVSADEEGIEHGVKLTMFDNSDPYDLDALDTYEINSGMDEWLYSVAVYERKALLIAPEKNLIGVPVEREFWEENEYGDGDYRFESGYMFFSFEDGGFVYKGEITGDVAGYNENDIFYRSVYVGDYVYILCGNKFVAANIETMEVTDEVIF